MSILVVGSVALDSIETPFGKVDKVLGGSATYFSVSASFFTRVNLVAVVGTDFPRKYVSLLRKQKVGLKGLRVADGKTFSWKGRYGYDFNNAETVYTHLNVFQRFSPKIPREYKKNELLFLANIDPELQLSVMKQMDRPRLTACDTMNYWLQSKRRSVLEVAKKVDIFLLNESEARQFSQESNLLKAGRSILSLGPKRVVIKKGEHGVLLFSRDSVFSAPAYLLETINDPTGAGDTFAGGFMGYLGKKKRIADNDMKKAVIYGTVMASYTVEDFSLRRLSRLKPKDIKGRYKDYRRLTEY
ncbi:MAG: PfkB family carbohydrate kinase [Candidatus Omnitrophota bacterium]